MNIYQRLVALTQAVGGDVKGLFTNQGALTDLQTNAKTNLVAAINELYGVAHASEINDSAVGTTTTYSSAKIVAVLNAASVAIKDDIMGGAGVPEALNTLKELAEAIQNDQSIASGLITALSGKVSFTEAQTLTETQKGVARSNIGAASATDLTALSASTSANFDTVNNNLSSLDSRTTAVEAGVSAANTAIANTNSAVSTIQGNVSALQASAAAAAASVTDLQTQVTTNKNASESRDVTLQSNIDALDASVTTRVAAAKTEVLDVIGNDVDLLAIYVAAKAPY